MPPFGRWAVRIAVAVLLLDAVLLGVAGMLTSRPLLLGFAALAALAAAGSVALWRRQRRRWDEVTAARLAAQAELHGLARALKEGRPRP